MNIERVTPPAYYRGATYLLFIDILVFWRGGATVTYLLWDNDMSLRMCGRRVVLYKTEAGPGRPVDLCRFECVLAGD